MAKDVEILERQRILDGFFKLDRYRLRHTRFEGGWAPEIVRERIEELAAVSVLLFDPDRDEVVLVEQFRIGLLGSAPRPWSIETVSGFCDTDHETPEQVARREVVEETGCELLALTHIGSFFVSPGMSVERIHLYCGRVDAAQADGVHGLAHEGEEIRVVRMSRTDAMSELFKRLDSTSVVIALQWLDANRRDLSRRWGAKRR
jgi:ADP-ribose pyrophosphatase